MPSLSAKIVEIKAEIFPTLITIIHRDKMKICLQILMRILAITCPTGAIPCSHAFRCRVHYPPCRRY